ARSVLQRRGIGEIKVKLSFFFDYLHLLDVKVGDTTIIHESENTVDNPNCRYFTHLGVDEILRLFICDYPAPL
ncbi:MAG: hypothetical protein CMO22_01050, partial [Thiotrichales bacterium]